MHRGPFVKGGIWLRIYKNSLSLVFIFLFAICFLLHFYGSLKDENEELLSKRKLGVVGRNISAVRVSGSSFSKLAKRVFSGGLDRFVIDLVQTERVN